MLNNIVSAVSQHLLDQAEWARTRLAEFSGKRLQVNSPAGAFSAEISRDGYLVPIAQDQNADLEITLSPLAPLRWFSDRQAVMRGARVDGDAEMAAAISDVAANLNWDFEDDLSRVVGDVAAYRIAQGVRRLSTWSSDTAESVGRSVAEYLTEESHTLATPLQLEQFIQDVDDLRDALERLDKRIDRVDADVRSPST